MAIYQYLSYICKLFSQDRKPKKSTSPSRHDRPEAEIRKNQFALRKTTTRRCEIAQLLSNH